MNVLDPGHCYTLASYDGGEPQVLTFVKREGAGYPGNVGHYPGTNCQEVLRVLADRVKYLGQQVPCNENRLILAALRSALVLFELRAARRHKRQLAVLPLDVERVATDPRDGHIHLDPLDGADIGD